MSDIDLITELAIGIARRLTDILEPTHQGDGAPPGHIHHSYSSAFEQGCGLLWQINLASAANSSGPVDRDGAQDFPPYFRLLTKADIRKALSNGLPDDTLPFPALLDAFVALACDYGTDADRRLPHNRAPFTPALVNLSVVSALAEHGYLACEGTTFAWTDNIAPAMVAAGFWDETGQALSDLAEAQVQLEALRALDTMPPEISTRSVFALTDHLRHRWTANDWQRRRSAPPRSGASGSVGAPHSGRGRDRCGQQQVEVIVTAGRSISKHMSGQVIHGTA